MAHLVLRAAQTADADLIARMLAELGYSARSENVVGRLAAVQQEGGTVLIAEGANAWAIRRVGSPLYLGPLVCALLVATGVSIAAAGGKHGAGSPHSERETT